MGKSRKNRRNNRKSRRNRRTLNGGNHILGAPVNWSNPGPMVQNFAQGQGFKNMHEGQHGGMAPYPGSFGQVLPAELNASARINSTLNAYGAIRGMTDQAGGRRRKNRRNSRKNRRNSRRQNGGLVRWGGGMRGGAAINFGVDGQSPVSGSTMLIPDSLRNQAGLHSDWNVVQGGTPSAWMPK